ncbi:MAG: hypothetical protein JSW09_07285 [Pseudomonadota bacterium]|nr:MAG: hypothetical protein JSW09_07285 [Pseudomonadota bacterium]
MIVYLHGLNSSGGSAKARWLRERLPALTVLAPTYVAHDAAIAPGVLRGYIAHARMQRPHDRKLLLVGSSLGGFWAQVLAPTLGAGMALINPALLPDESLQRYLGPQRNDATGESYELTRAHIEGLARVRPRHCDASVPTLVLLDEADEVIDYRLARDFYRGCGKTLLYPGGSHRFEHMVEALPEILALYDSL